MGSWNRPLPGVRLGGRGNLIPGCEWHISPLGRSYFVNHSTRTTSWRKHPPELLTSNLMSERIIEGHSGCIWSLACLSTCCHIMSTSTDGSIRQWTRDGEPVGKPWIGDGEAEGSIAVSPDNTRVASGSADGRIRLWNVGEGNVIGDPWDGYNAAMTCLDWSPSGLEISNGSEDGTLGRWNPDTGKRVTSITETGHGWVFTVKYSPQGD
ncbi:WD40 repeat-like protein [Rhizopogon salebrosus TDB-379]|nr:WD40 repeat-like protein [Rhizopogon salebrosus TDB-379]